MTTLVYAFGAKPPRSGEDLIAAQISAAHKYYNRLIELRRAQHDATEAARLAHSPKLAEVEAAVAAADAEVDDLIEAIRRRNAAARRKTASAEDRAALAIAKERRKELWARRKAIREAMAGDVDLQAKLAAIYTAYQGMLPPDDPDATRRSGGHFKEARATCGVYSGTYLAIEQAVEAAVKKTIGPPRFRRWNGDGLVAVQLQGGMTWPEALNGTTQLRIERDRTPRSPKRAPVYIAHVRVGSQGEGGKGGAPVWASVPFYLHRELPADARIMGVSVIRRQVAVRRKADGLWHPYYEWAVNFTLRTDAVVKPRGETGACGVDLGWRVMGDGSLRVAYVVGDDGRNEQFTLPPKLLRRWEKCRDLQSIRDQAFDAMRAMLGDWLAVHEHPDWLTEAAKFMGQWKAKGKLAHVLRLWRDQRFDGDGEMFTALETWQARDAHLWQYQRHNELKAQRIRRDMYRRFAAKIAAQYRTVVVEDCDWRKLARLPAVTNNEVVNETARFNQRIASIGMLRAELLARGALKSPAENTTKRCYVCGVINEWDHAELFHACDDCGATWDQDDNAARNLLASATMVGGGAGSVRDPEPTNGDGVAPPTSTNGGRWARRKAARSQKAVQTV